ncbi:diaminohydroxyphosphoribosylaminopyrimidine deaminase [Gammaproteobacteria bacterium 42_54_T18]|nr:diaminohydroxyphosphoribosylaminopyrimidine deaminase [Gammaproteobacteria bacterium 42_54_T18]
MTANHQNITALVTGANGYIASWLVKYLLEQGFTVHATVRDKTNQNKVSHLQTLIDEHPGKLTLFNADLFNNGDFDASMEGCEFVFHTASPFIIRGLNDPQAELIDPALKGTRNVLESANRTHSVKRVILTSSVVAIYGDYIDMQSTEKGIFTEAHWNTTSSINHQPYSYSKTLAEQEAIKIHAAQSRWDMVTVNPGLVLGPSLAKASDSTSLSTMLELMDGTLRTGAPELRFPLVDVRDVAIAHINAATTAKAQGRHVLVAGSQSMLEMANTIRKKYGSKYGVPRWQVPKPIVWLVGPFMGITRDFVANNVGHAIEFDNQRARKKLSVEFRPIAETVHDHAEQIIADGLV